MKKLCLILWSIAIALPIWALDTPNSLDAKVASSREVQLSWDVSGTDITSLQVSRSFNGTSWVNLATVNASEGTYTDAGLSPKTVYGYRIRAKEGATYSDYVYSEVVATPDAPLLPNVACLPGSTVSVQHENTSNPNESSKHVIDDEAGTKYLFGQSSGWIAVKLSKAYAVTEYAIVSANDAADRDPKSWALEASTDGSTWTELDAQTNQLFIARQATMRYLTNNTEEYQHYRLKIKTNNGSGMTQLAEFKLFAERSLDEIMAEDIAAPTNFTPEIRAFHLTALNWTDNASNETSYLLQRSTDGTNWDWEKRIGKNNTFTFSTSQKGETTYHFRLRAENEHKQSEWATCQVTTPADIVPEVIVEDWFEHQGTELYLSYKNEDVAVYYDVDMVTQNLTWPNDFFTAVWKHNKDLYGDYSDPRLYCFFHAQAYSGGHPSTWAGERHHYRNMIDNGSGGSASHSWQDVKSGCGIPVHEISHIIEGGSWLMMGSPEAGCWEDSKFAEIHGYDVQLVLSRLEGDPFKMKPILKSLYDDLINHASSSVPSKDCYWFRYFYYPIYNQFGEGKVLSDFFYLMYSYYPQHNNTYTGSMNYGEFFHFYSGACGTDIRKYAEKAFGWSTQWEYQFKKAQVDYPFTYSEAQNPIANEEGQIVSQYETTTNANTNPERLIDGDNFSKYARAIDGSCWLQYNAEQPYLLSGYNITNGPVAERYDPVDWTLSGSNDGESWDLLDTRSDESFLTRSFTKHYPLETKKAYKHYRLNITKINSGKTLELGEWELIGMKGESDEVSIPIVKNQKEDFVGPIDGLAKVYDMTGRQISSQKLTASNWDNLIATLALPQGSYICQFIAGGEVYAKAFVVK